MNYITNYYKNLSEQLQEQVNYLIKTYKELNEAVTPPRVIRYMKYLDNLNTSSRAAMLDNWSARMRKFIDMDPSEINTGALWGETPEFQDYVLHQYGVLQQVNGSYQRQLPDGSVQHWNQHYGWQNINKPGANTFFGPIGPDGKPMGIPPGGFNPLDVSYSPSIPFGRGQFTNIGGQSIPRPGQPGSGTGNINPLLNPGT